MKIKISMILNGIISILVFLGTIFMMYNVEFMGHSELLVAKKIHAFKYFTVDSNIFMGVVSLLLLIFEVLFITKKIKIPKLLYYLKLMATTAVMLTFIVTLFFLVPTSEMEFYEFYLNSNLFFHLIVPILSFVSFVFFEKCELSFKSTFLSIVPMFCYSIYYLTMIFEHLDHGRITYEYDFYGFFRWGNLSIIIVFPIITLITYFIGYGIYHLNKKYS